MENLELEKNGLVVLDKDFQANINGGLLGIAVAVVGWGSFVVRTAVIVGVAAMIVTDIANDYQEGYNAGRN